ncbi:MAG: hypothetical protein J0I43_02995 [Microbacterium sp.]|uniref:hypothetical protein n=1 Tax=Microbacterium sp. TaxID=51671 RepID=UPI001AD53318|nr:hypothetical protein [Microbacterium sp.]MBN9176320.1 hypothetical protein [Microbacterium sp.]
MSTPDQPDTPQLTRRQLRELRNTASNPIITPEQAQESAAAVAAPLPRAAEPVTVEDAPTEQDVDLGSPALTRRAARQQERLRTASVPVVDEDIDAHEDPDSADAPREDPGSVDVADPDTAAEALAEAQSESPDIEVAPVEPETTDADSGDADDEPRAVVAPTFGSGLLAGEGVELDLPASFDQLLTRGSAATGSLAASNALILSQTPETGAFTSPIAGTGEVLVTGTYSLPESFGSTGTSRGSSDGKEIDAILVDGELPATSSPTPIAASSAISTIKSAEDIIKPPAPEKGSRLMIALGITAGALALALMGVLIVALFTGAFR